MLNRCLPCRAFLARHRRAVRWAAFTAALCLFFFWLGTVAKPVTASGFCRVYF
ncbi:hypothetical protein AZSI13_22320 [Azospira sp. I13]|jgi:hypothetical protein|uniref:hypothetical protein n=1 Tax=Azospira sp. I13 TaxID=1765050 RepID=UPI000D4471B9|nr:hypothetical protein [Azospira sp. I13]GBG02905.1 hypothetical protein AZSI13_22320 [Azospira sp. I13]